MFEQTSQIFNGPTTLGALAEMCFDGNMELAMKLLASEAFKIAIKNLTTQSIAIIYIYMDDQQNFSTTPAKDGRCKKLVLKVVNNERKGLILTVSDEE